MPLQARPDLAGWVAGSGCGALGCEARYFAPQGIFFGTDEVSGRAPPVRWSAGAPPPCPTRWACRCQIFADIVEVVRRQMIRYANRMTTEACDRLPARASGAELCPGAAELATHAVKYGALADPSGHGLSRWHIHKVAWQ